MIKRQVFAIGICLGIFNVFSGVQATLEDAFRSIGRCHLTFKKNLEKLMLKNLLFFFSSLGMDGAIKKKAVRCATDAAEKAS